MWDTLLVFPDEIRHVWRGGITLAKLAYVLNHYASVAILTVLTYVFSGLMEHAPTKTFCVDAFTIGLSGGVISLGIGNYLVLLQVWQLWEQRAGIRLALTLGWAASYIVTLVFACVVIGSLDPLVTPLNGFNTCALSHIPTLIRFMWASPIVYEVLVFIFTIANALHRPRPADISLVKALYRDGVVYFVSLFILRVLNLVVTSLSPTPFVHVGSTLIWESNVVALNRLIINQRVLRPHTDNPPDYEMFTSTDSSARVCLPGALFDDCTFEGIPDHKRSLSQSSDITLRDSNFWIQSK